MNEARLGNGATLTLMRSVGKCCAWILLVGSAFMAGRMLALQALVQQRDTKSHSPRVAMHNSELRGRPAGLARGEQSAEPFQLRRQRDPTLLDSVARLRGLIRSHHVGRELEVLREIDRVADSDRRLELLEDIMEYGSEGLKLDGLARVLDPRFPRPRVLRLLTGIVDAELNENVQLTATHKLAALAAEARLREDEEFPTALNISYQHARTDGGRIALGVALSLVGDSSRTGEFLPLLIGRLSASDDFVRAEAVSSLGLLKLTDTTGHLAATMKDSSRRVRLRAVEALARSNDPNAGALLSQAASGSDPIVAQAAQKEISTRRMSAKERLSVQLGVVVR